VPLILLTLLAFAVVGLRSERFGWQQNTLIAAIAVWLVTVQFLFARFL
jgi:hypothetical protein